MTPIQILGLDHIPIVQKGDNIGGLIWEAVQKRGLTINDGDVVVVSHIIVSRAEGRTVDLKTITPSVLSKRIARSLGKDPRLVEVILREAKSIVRTGDGHLIVETEHGFICANAGVDQSNVPGTDMVALLPKDPDASARRIRIDLKRMAGKDVAVLISDTHGRPFREGDINVAIGVSGLKPIYDRRGEKDLFGRELRVKMVAIADELTSAAELVMGQADESVPVAIIKGCRIERGEGSWKELLRTKEKDLFL
ncbi:MAG: coenzyme F420-0:L-glutamate ligase [Candidatus Bathyarchaeia archaeon]